MSRKITIGIILGVTAILIGWDIFVAVNPPQGDTISEIIQEFATKHPVIPFAFGVLMGHFFWPVKPIK